MMLTDPQIERYSRQILLPEVGGRGQESILATRVEVVGDGLAARTAARYLCAAGIGCLVVRCGTSSATNPGEWELENPDCRVMFNAPGTDVPPNLVIHAGMGPADGSIDHRCARRLVGAARSGHATVADLGRSCAPCAVTALASAEMLSTGSSGPLDDVAEFVTGTLLAQEALALLLAPERPAGRSIVIGVADATAQSHPSTPLLHCPHAASDDG